MINNNRLALKYSCFFCTSLLFFLSYLDILRTNIVLGTGIKYIEYSLYLFMALFCFINPLKIRKREFYIWTISVIVILVSSILSRDFALCKAVILMFFLRGSDFKQICKRLFYATFLTLAIGIVLYALDISNSGVTRRGYTALGFYHPNSVGLLITLMVLSFVLWKENYVNKKNIWISSIFGFLAFAITGSRTSLMILIVVPIIYLICGHFKNLNKSNSIFKYILYNFPSILYVVSYMAAKYVLESEVLAIIDKMVSLRLSLFNIELVKYGVSIIGKDVELVYTDNVQSQLWGGFFDSITVDSTYMIYILKLGIMSYLVMAFVFYCSIKKAFANNDFMIAVVSIALAIYGFYEGNFIQPYCFFTCFYCICKKSCLD